jgi:hypothetical protein
MAMHRLSESKDMDYQRIMKPIWFKNLRITDDKRGNPGLQ